MIEILNYERVSKNKIIGYVDIRIVKWDLVIRRIAHLQSGDKKWFNFPCYPVDQPDGSKKYFSYIGFKHDSLRDQLFGIMTEELKKYFEKNSIAPQAELNFDDELPF